MDFELVGDVTDIETIATASGIREVAQHYAGGCVTRVSSRSTESLAP